MEKRGQLTAKRCANMRLSNLSIAKAQCASARIFEVKYIQYTLFATIMLKPRTVRLGERDYWACKHRSAHEAAMRLDRLGSSNRLANRAGYTYDACVR